MAIQDEEHSQLLRNIEQMNQMAFDAFKNGSTCVPQFLFQNGKPNGFRREERFGPHEFADTEIVKSLGKLLPSGWGHVKVMFKDNKVVLYIAEETIKVVP